MVGRLRNYIIPFKGLREGTHQFDFEIDDEFFERFGATEITEGSLKAGIVLHKETRLLTLDFDIRGLVRVVCDRCLGYFYLPLEYNGSLFFKFGPVRREETDNSLIIPYDETEIDVSRFIYEFIHLSLPYKKIHPKDVNGNSGCDKDMTERLSRHTRDDQSGESIPDPGWDDLKEYLKKNQ